MKQQLKGPPPWSAMNPILNKPLPLTRIAKPPLIPAPAHEYSILMTVLNQAQKINTILVIETHKTVVSLEMVLYKPAQKPLMAKRNEIKNVVLRPGELHTVISMLVVTSTYMYCNTSAAHFPSETQKLLMSADLS